MRYWLKNTIFFILLTFDAAVKGSRESSAMTFGVEKLECLGYLTVKNITDMFSCLDTIPACDRRRDRRTICDSIVRATGTLKMQDWKKQDWN